MTVASIIMQKISMRKSVLCRIISQQIISHPRPRVIQIRSYRHKNCQENRFEETYIGIRRMAESVSRELDVPINRKQIQRIYRKTGMISPQKTKKDIKRSNRKPLKPTEPNQLWEMEMTYIWCGIDSWCLLL